MEALTVPGVLESLPRLREYVAAAAKQANLGRRETSRLKLAVDEIATNSITHGYNEKRLRGELSIRAEPNESGLTIVLEDTGEPFDPTQAEAPKDIDLSLEERDIGGLGIFLTLRQISEFRYERDGDRNRNIFVVKKDNIQKNGEVK